LTSNSAASSRLKIWRRADKALKFKAQILASNRTAEFSRKGSNLPPNPAIKFDPEKLKFSAGQSGQI